ncbi:HAD family hydrolase [Streptomyces sp. NPDC001770]
METIVFDIGETLVRDDRHWASWADWLGVPAHTVSALVGAAVVGGGNAADALALLRPGMDVAEAELAREAAGRGEHLGERDLYPDVRPALAGLRSLGFRVVVAGHRSMRATEQLRALDLPADLVVTSAEWGVAKPDPEFFTRVLKASDSDPRTTVYVGDHPAEDLFPAQAAGLRTAHLRRGPYGHWWADHPDVVESADWRVDALTELTALPGLVRERGNGSGGTGSTGTDGGGEGSVRDDPARRPERGGTPTLRALRSVR